MEMILPLIISLIILQATAIPPECNTDESYWCRDLHTAKSCEAIHHCMDTVWKTHIPTKENSDVCMYCQTLVEDLRQQPLNSESKLWLKAACEVIPDQSLASQCSTLVNNDFPGFLHLIGSDLPPGTVCSLVKLCAREEQLQDAAILVQGAPVVLHRAPLEPIVDGPQDVCADCEKFVKDLIDYVSTPAGQDTIKKFIDDNFCTFLGTESEECVKSVEKYLGFALLFLHQFKPVDICSRFKLCNNTAVQVHKLEPLCSDCKTFMNDVQALLMQPATLDTLENEVIKTVCASLPGLDETCTTLVKNYLPDVVKIVLDDFPLVKFCDTLQICNVTNGLNKLMTSKLYYKAKDISTPEECTVCQEVFNAIKLIDENPLVQQQIAVFLTNQLCKKLSGDLQLECNTTVQMFLPEIFQLINTELAPVVICKALGLCSNSTKQVTFKAIPSGQEAVKSKLMSSETCILCEFIMKELDSMLANNASEEEIIATLDKVCSVFPDTLQNQCRDFVSTYGPAIVELLLQELQPAAICKALGLCNGVTQDQFKGQGECTVCKTIIIYMRSLLSKNSTEQEIDKVLQKVCNYVPVSVSQECTNFIQLYGDQLVQLLVSDITPQEVCHLLKLCEAPVKLQQAPPLLGAKECSWGPAYWCANKENAQKCKAEEHCRRYVWKN